MRQLIHIDCLGGNLLIFSLCIHQEDGSIFVVNHAMPHKGEDVEYHGLGFCALKRNYSAVLYLFLDFF